MSARRWSLLLGALALAAVAGHRGPALAGPPDAAAGELPADAPLKDRIDASLAAKFLKDATVSVKVVDVESGKVLYEKNASKALNPASNVKLVTTAAALELLGPEHRYSTRVLADPTKIRDGVLQGPIYLKGTGDPALVTGDLYELAIRIRARGITKITGGVIVDSGRFDSDGLPPGFDQKEEFASYRAPIGATSVNFNTYLVRAHGGGTAGAQPRITIDPPVASIVVVNEAKTVDGQRNRLKVSVDEGAATTTVTVRGDLGADAPAASYRYPVSNPSGYAGETFRLVLRQAGVKMPRRAVKTGTAPARARIMSAHRSPTLGVLIRSVNKMSNNFMAEQILRTLAEGDGGSAEASLERLRTWTQQRGVPQPDLRLGNGSGLYDNNRVSADQLTAVLQAVYGDFRYRADYLASLSVMGVDGTLRRRLKESDGKRWIRGKTGTLDGVSALSGYAGAADKSPVAFSIIMNDLDRWETGAARRVQNEIAQMVALELAGTPAAD
jgi:D-alanyl-D-alanine carboxypeptidase/D-alanyl-D-alanine-endopeptidase (penicillin-binding protein 4)